MLPNLSALRAFPVDARRYLINTAVFGMTLDGGINAVIFNLFVLRLGFDPQFVGVLGSIGMLIFAFASLPSGQLGGRIGLRRALLIGALLSGIGSAALPMIPLLDARAWPAALIAATALINIGLALYFANGAPYLAASAGEFDRNRLFSVQSALYASSGFLGSILGGYLPQIVAGLTGTTLASMTPYRWTLAVVPLLLLLSIHQTVAMGEPPEERAQPAADSQAAGGSASSTVARTTQAPRFLTPRAAILLIVALAMVRFLQVGGVGASQTFFNVYMDQVFQVSAATIGNVQAAAKLIGIPIALSIPLFTRRFGNVAVSVFASAASGLAMLPMAFAPAWWVAGLGYVFIWLVTPMRYASFTVFSLERTPQHLRSTMNGAQEMFAGLSFALISVSGGYLIGTLGYPPLFLLGAALCLLSVAALIAFVIWSKRAAR